MTPTQRRTLTWSALAAAASVLVWLLAPVPAPFIVAAVLASILPRAMQWLARRRVPCGLAARPIEAAVLAALLTLRALLALRAARLEFVDWHGAAAGAMRRALEGCRAGRLRPRMSRA